MHGKLLTLELSPEYAAIAKKNLASFEFCSLIEVREGDAVESLRGLYESGPEPFDLIFLDADKAQYSDYLHWSIKLSRRGTMIIADNVVRDGAVLDDSSEDPKVQGVREFNTIIAESTFLRATAVQTVGAKGYDGFSLIWVESEAR